MSFRILIASSCLMLAAAEAAEPSNDPTSTSAGPTSAADQPSIINDPAWRELIGHLGTPRNRIAHFEERRFFPFRSEPIVLTGDVRIVPDRGISLSYLGAKPYVVIVDPRGVLMRDHRGRQRAAPDDSRAHAVTSALFHVLRFDLPALEKDFSVAAARDARTWTLQFTPRDPALGSLLGTVTVRGEEFELQHIEVARADGQRIEIALSGTREDVIFPSETLQRYFR